MAKGRVSNRMPDARWPMPDARCPMPDARCPMAEIRYPTTDNRHQLPDEVFSYSLILKGPGGAAMRISIEYCTVWNYEPRAASLAAELKERFPDAEIEMIPSGHGRFEVMLDGVPIFEKSRLKRHAARDEIVRLLEKRVGWAWVW